VGSAWVVFDDFVLGMVCLDLDTSAHDRYGFTGAHGGLAVIRLDSVFAIACNLDESMTLKCFFNDVFV
jgi:hypothetical protein